MKETENPRMRNGGRKREEANKRLKDKRNIRKKNRIKMIKEEFNAMAPLKRMRIIVGTGICLILVAALFEFILSGTVLKKSKFTENLMVERIMGAIPDKEYKTYSEEEEYQILWKKLMKHFDNNKTATLGVMCNLNSESGFKANNLEDYNNQAWGIEDGEYTEKINDKVIDKKDFLESRNQEHTNGYYNEYNEWVNVDGGYGYGQYTAYAKKEELYQFAEQWFSPGGPGEDYKFNIADPEMQADYVVSLLESDVYKNMDRQLRNAGSVVDACYIWLKYYEIPYDPYNDGYYSLAFERAVPSNEIEASCDATPKKDADNGNDKKDKKSKKKK